MKSLLLLCLLAASGSAGEHRLTPAEYAVSQARTAIHDKPGDAGGYNSLAMALVRRAKETSDDCFYSKAGEAVRKSLELSPANFEGRKMDVLVLLGQDDYLAALTEAKVLNKTLADDVTVYGLLTDAYSGLGDYKNAEISAQWMLNLRPGNIPAFVHAANLREVFGDFNGLVRLRWTSLFRALRRRSIPIEPALLIQMGRERRLAGNNDEAERLLKQGLDLYPEGNLALSELGEVYLAEKRADDAVAVLEQLYKSVPTARSSYQLAEALTIAGRPAEARKIYADFLNKAIAESGKKKNANRELTLYYADYSHQPAKALETAEKEYAWRKDVFTLDSYAWGAFT